MTLPSRNCRWTLIACERPTWALTSAKLSATLRAMIGGDELIDINVDDEAVPILLESASGAINDPSDLVNLYVRSASGNLVSLSSIVTLREEGVATELNRRSQRRSIDIRY